MSEPNHHHYVPECYLKPFANEKKNFYSFNLKYKHVKFTSIGKVCYTTNYFKITREETFVLNNVDDPYCIEKESFKNHENQYSKLLLEISNKENESFELPKKKVELFLEILITIKRRSPTIKKSITSGFNDYFDSLSFKKGINSIIKFSKEIDPIGTEEFLKGDYLRELKSEESLEDRFRSTFLKDSSVTKNVVSTLMKCKFFVAHTSSECEFITSDNPGYCLIANQLINIGGFDGAFMFIFPLSPLRCLVIDSESIDMIQLQTKSIHPISIGEKITHAINNCTSGVAIERLFALSKNTFTSLGKSMRNGPPKT